eukprot:1121406-Pyramimonas_sp.AAC.1
MECDPFSNARYRPRLRIPTHLPSYSTLFVRFPFRSRWAYLRARPARVGEGCARGRCVVVVVFSTPPSFAVVCK